MLIQRRGIEHQLSHSSNVPEQYGVVERRNRTLLRPFFCSNNALSFSKLPIYHYWAGCSATSCYTQNKQSHILRPERRHIHHHDRKPSIKHLHIFGCICYITRDGENLDKMKEKEDPCVMARSSRTKGVRLRHSDARAPKDKMCGSFSREEQDSSHQAHKSVSNLSDGRENGISNGPLKEGGLCWLSQTDSLIPDHRRKSSTYSGKP
ncbi:hypothetical protein Tco_0034282 [Tanacetum coccineum]|uniref:Uncharacterized protein n=1 Tax=Tanacetum coccineum TaxID=301880 RepID=A0ABQ5DA55_9ASTR